MCSFLLAGFLVCRECTRKYSRFIYKSPTHRLDYRAMVHSIAIVQRSAFDALAASHGSSPFLYLLHLRPLNATATQPSPYGTWVSEVMLQQTRVETVVEYFVKWMTLFPTPKALAEADLEQVGVRLIMPESVVQGVS